MVDFWIWAGPLSVGGLVAIGPSLWSFVTKFWDPSRADQLSQQGWTRAGTLETEIKSLRILLDRCRRRESAKDAVISILLLALELGDDLTEEAATAFICRAKEILKSSLEDGSK